MKILLASMSPIKIQAVREVFPTAQLDCLNCSELHLPEQPINNTRECVLKRLEFIRTRKGYDLYLAIENGIENNQDIAFVAVNHGQLFESFPYEMEYINEFLASGVKTTYGKFLNAKDPSIPHDNWVKHYGYDRKDQIVDALNKMLD